MRRGELIGDLDGFCSEMFIPYATGVNGLGSPLVLQLPTSNFQLPNGPLYSDLTALGVGNWKLGIDGEFFIILSVPAGHTPELGRRSPFVLRGAGARVPPKSGLGNAGRC